MSFIYALIDDLNIRISELNIIKHRHEILSKQAVGDIQVISNRIARATQASSFSDEIA